MSEGPDFLSVLNIRLSQLKNMFDDGYNKLMEYCNKERNNSILKTTIPMSEDPDFISILNTRLSQLKNLYDNSNNKLIEYCNKERNSILNSNVHRQQKINYINKVKTYFKSQYNGIKEKYNADVLNAKKEHEQFMEIFSKKEKLQLPVKESEVHVDTVTFNQNKKALLVGCSYTNTQHKLNGCINDVNNIRDKLCKKYLFEDVTTMTDKTEVKPTKKNIIKGLKNLLSDNNPGDILFFSFSGHGTNTIDTSGHEKIGMDEMLVSLDMHCISDDEIKSIIQTHLNKDVTLFVLIDCCHSGSILDLQYQYSNNDSDNTISNNQGNYNTIGNVIMVSGCMDKQTSADAYISSNFQGAMTWAFLKAIKDNSSICWRDLIVNMHSLLKKSKYTQIPMLSSGNELDLDNKLCLL